MNQTQIIQLQNFITIAHSDINRHKKCPDHASRRVMMYSYGRVVGAYAMIGNLLGADTHEKVQQLENCYNEATDLTFHKN